MEGPDGRAYVNSGVFASIEPRSSSFCRRPNGEGDRRRRRWWRGHSSLADAQDRFRDAVGVCQNFGCGDPLYDDTLIGEPVIARAIPCGPIATVVSLTIDFEGHSSSRAEEIEHIGAEWVLAAEAHIVRRTFEPLP